MASGNLNQNRQRDENWSALMQAAQAGDALAYKKLLREIAPALKNFLRTRFFAKDHIEDVVQEILLAIHAARHTYRPEQPFPNWMYGVARHKMIDYLRKQSRLKENELQDELLETFLADGANTPEEALAGQDIRQALATLPDKQRQVLALTKIEGYSMAEAAEKLGMTETAAKVTAHRACKKMREWLVSYGYA
jgi:RNA polymerase sigma-70 factor (ECF subfamily)